MKKMRIIHLVVLLALLLAVSLQPANGQTPAEGSLAIETPSTAGSDGVITPETITLGGGPDYNSGWVAIAQGQTLTFKHNLGGPNTDNYWIDMEYRNSTGYGINKAYYGGADIGQNGDQVGIFWRNLDTSIIKVTRRPSDTFAEKVRIRIWNQVPPNYNSYWTPELGQGGTASYDLNLGNGDPNKYLVDLQFKDTTMNGYGINQRFFGGRDCGSNSTDCVPNNQEGASWYALLSNQISVFRHVNDTSMGIGNFRVRVWNFPIATYDSEWQDFHTDYDLKLSHNIGGNADDYVVDLEFQGELGINQIYYGGTRFGSNPRPELLAEGTSGDEVGGFWYDLTNSTIKVHRNLQDYYAPKFRIRIWNFWKPTKADYDSTWFTLNQGASINPPKPIDIPGGNADNYLVDMQFKNPIDGVNQRNYGINEIGTRLDQGNADDNVGAFWSNLTNNSITITRGSQDATVAQARVQIWNMPKPDFDSGWKSIIVTGFWTFTHDLGGSIWNYLVDLQFKSSTYGINQAGYGGMDTGTHSFTGLGTNQQVGAYWGLLNTSTITVFRRANDILADEVRVRIWRVDNPEYNSYYASNPPTHTPVNVNQSKTFTHSLMQKPENYFISTTFWDGLSNEVNQKFFGGADLANNDRVGAYWFGLTASQVSVFRRAEDSNAPQVDIRIWVTDYEAYFPILRK